MHRSTPKQVGLVALVTAAFIGAGLGAASRAAASSSSCADGGTTTKTGADDYEIRFCGAAVVTVRIRNRTYIFRDGACFDANGKGILLYTGTEVIHDGELANVVDGRGLFISLGLGKSFAGASAYDGPHPLIAGKGAGGLAPLKPSGTGTTGTFSGRSLDPGKTVSSHAKIAFSGTWTCGGQIHSWADFVANVNRPVNGLKVHRAGGAFINRLQWLSRPGSCDRPR